MCGIIGYVSKQAHLQLQACLKDAVKTLSKRGPDLQQDVQLSPVAGFAHARLSIIDTSSIANQPMSSASGRFTIIFNGEIFNFRELQQRYLSDVALQSHSDTEVLLYLFVRQGKNCVNLLNGFFAFAVFDHETGETFIARDRYGIKPLHIYNDDSMVVFASELKAIMRFPIKKQIDYNTLALYLQLNYIPPANSMLKYVSKLEPGCYATVSKKGDVRCERYYSIPYAPGKTVHEHMPYDAAASTLNKLVEEAVQRRLISDVPLGAFLSGGIDSSIVTACASRHTKHLNTFSIGYKDEPYFDETKYADLVAKKFETNHTVFSISNDEMFANIFDILNYIDEPFADSSAIAVYILSRKTRQHVTVALSGDGGDELFAGYNKHSAELRARSNSFINTLVKAGRPIFSLLPKSRHSAVTNLFRQLDRYSTGLTLSASERYWRWCTLQSQQQALDLLADKGTVNESELEQIRQRLTNAVTTTGDINDVLYADMQLVLPGDMLTKVDIMSMANSLEVRVPLLDYTVVDFAFSLPVSYKITPAYGKRILKDAFRSVLPPELFTRPKHGFEVPLLKWLQTGLRSLIDDDLLNSNFISEQGIFNTEQVEGLKKRLYSSDPGDAHATIWALLVFQWWYKKYFL